VTGRPSNLMHLIDGRSFAHKMIVHGGRAVGMVIHGGKVKMCFNSWGKM
jgi:hypothetical protein